MSNRLQSKFSNLLRDVNEWAKSLGANLSLNKWKSTRIRAKNLGIIFDERFSFKQHCLQLKKDLTKRINNIKVLSQKECVYIILALFILKVSKDTILFIQSLIVFSQLMF